MSDAPPLTFTEYIAARSSWFARALCTALGHRISFPRRYGRDGLLAAGVYFNEWMIDLMLKQPPFCLRCGKTWSEP